MKKIFTLFAALVCMMSLQATTVTVTPYGNVGAVTVDGTTYNNLPITTQGDIHLVAINREGISLLVRYTDTNTVSAIGTVNGQSVNYNSDAIAAYAKTFQIPNSDFETWTSNTTEPRYWHGFKSAKGSLASMAAGTLDSSDEVRPGSSGTSSALIESSTYIVVNNGTMTNGQLNAQSMTAANTWNHSEMDQSSSATDKNGDKFYTALLAKPDAIKAWLKFSQGSVNTNYPYATLSAVLFNGKYYQDPEPKKGDKSAIVSGTAYTQADVDSAAARVAAKAQNAQITTGDWRELSIPFNYTNVNNAKAILVTVSTNATPGQGSDGDKVWVDDMELVYNAAISNIALNGVTVEGFNFNAATKNYDITYSGEALNLTADNFVVTTQGVSAIVVKNVENLGCGNYRIAIGVTSPDFKNGDLYTINLTHNPLTGKLYILGDVNGIGWHANNALEMTAANEDQTVFTAEVNTSSNNNYFSFTTKLAEDDNDGGWAYILPYRIGAPGEGTDSSVEISSTDLGTALPLGDWGKTRAYILPAGHWTFTVNLTARTLTVVEKMPDHLYILGDVNGKGWHANIGVEMTPNEAHTVFTSEVTTAGENNYFRFTTELAENDDDGGWSYILPFNIGAPNANQQITTTDYGTALTLGNWGQGNNFVLPAGLWNFSVDMSARTLTVTQVQQSIPGDVDGNGTVDVTDVNFVVNIILGKAQFANYPNADVDGNGVVDVTDVNKVVNIILGKN